MSELSPINRVRGITLVESLLASALFAIIVTGLVTAFLYGQEATLVAGQRERATLLAQEGLEAVKNLRDESFANLTDGTYGLGISSNKFALQGSLDMKDIFTRQIQIGSNGADRKNVTSTVSWMATGQRTGSISLTTLLTNWAAAAAGGNWNNPNNLANLNLSNNDDARKVQVQGDYAYVIRNGGTDDFVVVDISTPSSPTQVGTLTLDGEPSNLSVSGDYAYVASDSNSQELQIIDISTPSSPSLAGSYNDAGNQNALGVYANGSTVYLTLEGGTEFLVINTTVPSLPILLGSTNLSGIPFDISLIGSYAYISSGFNNQELQIVDVSVPAAPNQVGSLNLTGTNDAISIAGSGNTVYLGRLGGELNLVDVSTPSSPVSLGTFNAQFDIQDIALATSLNLAFLATTYNSSEFQIVDVSTPASASLHGFLNLSRDIYGVAYDETNDLTYVVSDANNPEFSVFQPL